MLSGLGIRYDLGAGHPLVGRRMPDLDLETGSRVYTLLHRARPVLFNFGEAGAIDIGPWADRVQSIDTTYRRPWDLPVIGTVPAPIAVLVRPDGYVAWASEAGSEGLAESLTTWFGPPALEDRGTTA